MSEAIGGRAPFNWDSIPVKTGVTADPAAGAQLATITVPAGVRWLFMGGSFVIVNSAVVVSRIPHLSIMYDGTHISLDYWGTAFIAASETVQVSFSPMAGNVDASSVGGYVVAIGGYLELPAGAVITITVSGLDGGDNIAPFYYQYKEARA